MTPYQALHGVKPRVENLWVLDAVHVHTFMKINEEILIVFSWAMAMKPKDTDCMT